MNLEWLLKQIERNVKGAKSNNAARYSITRIGGGWCFAVLVGDWEQQEKNLQTRFYGTTIGNALCAFLKYTEENKGS